jgi:phage terminase small subunit
MSTAKKKVLRTPASPQAVEARLTDPAWPLNERQRQFVREYIIDFNGTAAAIRAGYKKNSAKQQASELLTLPNIQAALSVEKAERVKRTQIDQDWVVKVLTKNVKRALQVEPVYDRDGNRTGEYVYEGAVVNGAARLLGQHLGMFVDRVDLTSKGDKLGAVLINGSPLGTQAE